MSIAHTHTFIAANCSFDKQKLDQVLGDDTRKLFDWEEPMSIKILVVGRVGVGKSSLVNALVGMDVAKTGTSVRGVTKNVERKVSIKNGIPVYITDTPGLGNVDINDEDILRTALEQSEGIDLFLFCMNMTHRFDHQYVEEMKAITNMFGIAIWKKGMIILTSANAWNEKEKFISKLHEWEDALRKITKQFIDLEVAKKIPIVPAGYKEPQLPDRPSWVTDIWLQGFRRMGFLAMIKYLIKTKMSDATDGVKPSKDMLEDQPLVTCYMSKDEVWINLEDTPMILKTICGPGVLAYTVSGVGNWVASALEYFGWIVKETEVHCYDKAIIYGLIAAYLEEHPKYKEA